MGYLKDTVKGMSWMAGLRVTIRVMGVVRIAVLARLLLPEQFGLYGIAALILTLLETFTEAGVNVFLIQITDDINKYINTAWIISIFRGILVSLLIYISAPFVSEFFKFPDALPLIYIVSIVPLIRGFINPAIIKLQKELEFNKEFWFKGFSYAVEAISVIVLAYFSRSAASLVWGLIISSFVEVILTFIIVKPLPKISFDFAKIKQIVGRGKWVTGYGIFDYLYQNLDDAFVGKILGATSLGVYQVAYKISSLPVSEIAVVVSRVTFPIYVKITDDKKRLKKAYTRTIFSSSIFMILMGILIFAFPHEIVLLVLGPSWLSAVPVLKILAIFGVFKGIVGIPQSLFLALEKQEYVMFVSLLSLLALIMTIVPFVNEFGIIGAAYSAVLGSVLGLLLALYLTEKIMKNDQ